MTTFESDNFRYRSDGQIASLSAIGSILSRWWAAHLRRIARRKAIRQMAEMPDWQLRDIGLNRGDVDRLIAANRISRDPANVDQFR